MAMQTQIPARQWIAQALFFAAMFFPVSGIAQTFTLVGESASGTGPLFVKAVNDVSIYKSGLDEEKRFFFNPFFYFESDSQGRLVAELSEESATESTVQLTILISPSRKVGEIARYLANTAKQDPSKGYFNGIHPSELLTIELAKLSCEDISPVVRFKTVRINEVSKDSRITLVSRLLPTNEAVKLRDNLVAGKTTLKFAISYFLNARFKESESHGGATIVSFYSTNAVKELNGSGRAFSVSNQHGSLATDATALSREQKEEFEGRLRNEISLKYDIEDPVDYELIERQIQKYFDTLFKQVFLNPEDSHFAGEIAKLNAYNFSPEDLKPDQIQKISLQVKDFFKSDQERFSSEDIAASASFLGFGGSAGVSHTKRELEALMSDKGWQFGQEGTMRVPKSLSVYVFNKSAITQQGQVKVQITRSYRQQVKLGGEITTKTLYNPEEAYDEKSELEELKAKVVENTPIGSVATFAGNLTKLPQGWLLCDGKEYVKIEYPALANALKETGWENSSDTARFKVPDLRGVFLRGSNVNGGQDPDNRAVGSFQSEMTRRPANAFTTNWSGNHSHGEGFTHHWQNLFNGSPNNIATDDRNWAGIAQADAYGSAGPKDRIFRYRPDEGGNHNHFIEGGDPETRPKNRSVYYIIKAR